MQIHPCEHIVDHVCKEGLSIDKGLSIDILVGLSIEEGLSIDILPRLSIDVALLRGRTGPRGSMEATLRGNQSSSVCVVCWA